MIRNSIKGRMLGAGLLILGGFLGLAAIALDAANQHRARTAMQTELQAHVYTLLAAAEEDERGRMRLPPVIASPRFNQPDSGLYAQVSGENGAYRWQSSSLLGRTAYSLDGRATGETRFLDRADLYVIEQGIAWADLEDNDNRYTFSVALDTAPFLAAQRAFRNSLLVWLGGGALALLVAQFVLVRWGLSPLRGMAEQVQHIERGTSDRLAGDMPVELAGLATNLNSLIRQNQKRQERVRNSLSDLAHSMKTPLAVLRGATPDAPSTLAELIDEQAQRIDEIVTYQRQRAAVAGSSAVNRPITLHPVIERFCNSLRKVHRDRHIDCRNAVDEDFRLRIDEGDLFELLGNLLENAFKHCAGVILVTADEAGDQYLLTVEDDGPGIPESETARVLQRGERADERHPGQGIGLAVVSEIVRQYDGSLHIDRSALGGARFQVRLG